MEVLLGLARADGYNSITRHAPWREPSSSPRHEGYQIITPNCASSLDSISAGTVHYHQLYCTLVLLAGTPVWDRDLNNPVSAVATLLPMYPFRHTISAVYHLSVHLSQSRLVADRILKSNIHQISFPKIKGQQTCDSCCRVESRSWSCTFNIYSFPPRISASSGDDESQCPDENSDENSGGASSRASHLQGPKRPRRPTQIRATLWVLHGEIFEAHENCRRAVTVVLGASSITL
jgi:hypothetical protein